MPSSGVIQAATLSHPLRVLEQELVAELQDVQPAPPAELIGDLLLALSQGRMTVDNTGKADLTNYVQMWHKISRGRRWRHLRSRVQPRQRRGSEHTEAERTVMKNVVKLLCDNCMRLIQDGEFGLENLGRSYLHEINDPSKKKADDFLVDRYVLVVVELLRRMLVAQAVNLQIHQKLVQNCLELQCDPHRYKTRQLRPFPRPGGETETLPGDFSGIRGVTKKTREDQIPKILPATFAPLALGEIGHIQTLDAVVNRSPPCYQHFDPHRPENSHRILLAFVVGVERGPGVEYPANVTGKTCVFDLLVNAALKLPHRFIQADVAWFERADGQWGGSAFPLRSLVLTDSPPEYWRNLVEVDKVLPTFFVHFAGAVVPSWKPEVTTFHTPPTDYLAAALGKRCYQAVYIVAVMRAAEKAICLPPASLVLPRFDAHTPTVLVCCAEDGQRDPQGDAFRDLMEANVAALPLPNATGESLVHRFMNMIIGPVEQRRIIPTIYGGDLVL